ncbi:hypothetical protein AB1Y20_020417 [Prymnesium parvum]|uniref:CCAAT-binding factor domain-containing protein n=1 Tax=Prymnesium parvum TaxID=97485 RepID=A0AB34JXB0_PRYPA
MDAASLRGELGKLIAGFSHDDAQLDPFSAPNEWEDEQRARRAAKPAKPADGKISSSRRAQQAAAKASRPPAASAEGAPIAVAAEKTRPQPKLEEKSYGKCKLPVCADWWEELAPAPADGAAADEAELRERAELLYEKEIKAHTAAQEKKHGADHRMMKKLLSAGTVKDKIAALTVQVQESSFHSLPFVRQLIAMAERPAKEIKIGAVEALCELFLTRLLPPRALVPLHKARLPADVAETPLLQAYFEDELKRAYAALADVVMAGVSDNLIHFKQLFVGKLYAMLSSKPELERKLLPALINKLGDTEKKVASRVTHLLNQLMLAHPLMKPVVLAEVQRFVLRPNVSHRAQYYASVLMNQMILTRREPELANTLLLIYLAMFAARTSKDQPLDTRMLSCLLSGMHRAVPFCSAPGEVLLSQLSSLYRCAHSINFSTGVQALMVLSHVTSLEASTADRFYRALYESLLHPELPTSAKQALFLNVLYKAMKADTNLPRSMALAKRLLQACVLAPPSFICAALLLLAEVMKAVPALRALVAPKAAAATPLPRDESGEAAAPAPANSHAPPGGYDWQKRDPAHARADESRLWEVAVFTRHFHPSVRQFATALSTGAPITYGGDPLKDFQLMAFLDKFVFKNPKQNARSGGGSIMQPAPAARATAALTQRAMVAQLTAVPVEKVAAHEHFFHTYFTRRREVEEKRHKKMGTPTKVKKSELVEGVVENSDDEMDEYAQQLAKSIMKDEEDDLDDDEDSEDDQEDEDDEDEDEEGDDDEVGEEADGDSELGEEPVKPKRRKRVKGPTYADASEFAHILEEAADEYEGVNPRLAEWEQGKRSKRRK